MNNEIVKFQRNAFYYYANEYRKRITDENELEQLDITDLYIRETNNMVKNGEIVKIAITAKPREGKSTVAITEAMRLFQTMQEIGQIPKNKEFGMENLARDQMEFHEMMKNDDFKFTTVAIDEINKSEQSGENTTIIEKGMEDVSNLQADRYVHSIACSPREILDPNADIILSVTSKDKKSMTTQLKLYYRYYEAGQEFTQLLGYVRICVADLIYNWEKHVKHLIYKKDKITPQEKQKIDEWAKKDFYIRYVLAKRRKVEFFSKDFITRPRMVLDAEPIIEVIEQLKPIVRLKRVSDKLIQNFVKEAARKHRREQSIIGRRLMTEEISGVLELYRGHYEWEQRIHKILTARNDPKTHIGKMGKTDYLKLLKSHEDAQQLYKEKISKMMEELYKYQELGKEYEAI